MDQVPFLPALRTGRIADRRLADLISKYHVPEIIGQLHRDGFDVTIGTRFDLLADFHQQHRPEFGLFSIFRSDLYRLGPENGAVLFVSDAVTQELVASSAVRRLRFDSNLCVALESGEFFGQDAREPIDPEASKVYVDCDLAEVIRGDVVYSGAILKRGDYPQARLTSAMIRLIHAWSFAQWPDFSWIISFLERRGGVERRTTHVDYGIRTLSSTVWFDLGDGPAHEMTLAGLSHSGYRRQVEAPRYADLSVPMDAPPAALAERLPRPDAKPAMAALRPPVAAAE